MITISAKVCTDSIPTVTNAASELTAAADDKVQYQDTVEYTCVEGHILDNGDPSIAIMCNADGEWDDAPDACNREWHFE